MASISSLHSKHGRSFDLLEPLSCLSHLHMCTKQKITLKRRELTMITMRTGVGLFQVICYLRNVVNTDVFVFIFRSRTHVCRDINTSALKALHNRQEDCGICSC